MRRCIKMPTRVRRMRVSHSMRTSRPWRCCFIGTYDYSDVLTETQRTYDTTNLQVAINAGQVNPYGVLPL